MNRRKAALVILVLFLAIGTFLVWFGHGTSGPEDQGNGTSGTTTIQLNTNP